MNFAEAIANLGETPDQVSLTLRDKGITGRPRSACWCPVAEYLKSCGFPYVSVGLSASRYESYDAKDPLESISLPIGVQDWILEFDGGKHNEFSNY